VNPVSLIAAIAYWVLSLYFWIMWARFILDLARQYARSWRPKGVLLPLSELVFTLTDPPINFVRRTVKPIRIGGMALDLSWSIVMLAVVVLIYVTLVLQQF
jgi:YggT family protein